MFGAIAGSIKKITGEADGAQQLRDAEIKIKLLEDKITKLEGEQKDETT
jgi:hypothetical protein